MKKKMTIIFVSVLLFLIGLIAWVIWGNSTLKVTEYRIENSKIPQGFEGFKIVQISDLHNAEIGKDNEKLVKKVKEVNPDIIVITGDYIDSRNSDTEVGISLSKKLVKIAPVYYINGNHEPRVLCEYEKLKKAFNKIGVTVLENEKTTLESNGDEVTLAGLYDVGYLMKRDIDDQLKILGKGDKEFDILLAHRPEYFGKYEGYDLTLAGHSHGGQIRIPFIGGVFAPDQGLFPQYDGGIYEEDERKMVVSRGIGNSAFPVRINNRPEIVVIELSRK